jgi:hypothetical protein
MKSTERILVAAGVALILLGLCGGSLVQRPDRDEGKGENGCGHYCNSGAHWPVWGALTSFGHVEEFPLPGGKNSLKESRSTIAEAFNHEQC